jgi:predicted nucleic acid-binding protein
VTVSDTQVATLRAMLTGNRADYKRLLGQLDRQHDGLGFNALLTAAFVRAADRRFGKHSTRAEIIDFVADTRSRSDEIAEAVNPQAGERLIRKVTAGESTDDIDAKTSSTAKALLLATLVADANMDDTALDEFMASARKLADYFLS